MSSRDKRQYKLHSSSNNIVLSLQPSYILYSEKQKKNIEKVMRRLERDNKKYYKTYYNPK